MVSFTHGYDPPYIQSARKNPNHSQLREDPIGLCYNSGTKITESSFVVTFTTPLVLLSFSKMLANKYSECVWHVLNVVASSRCLVEIWNPRGFAFKNTWKQRLSFQKCIPETIMRSVAKTNNSLLSSSSHHKVILVVVFFVWFLSRRLANLQLIFLMFLKCHPIVKSVT